MKSRDDQGQRRRGPRDSQNQSNRNRGGNRNRSRNRSGHSGGYRSEPRRKKAPPPTLVEKFLAFFGMGKKSAKPTASKGAVDKSNRPGGRSPGGDGQRRSEGQARERRAPEPVEVTTPRLYVGNLSYDATESDLFELFSGVGKVQNAEIVTHKHTQRSKGYAFIQMTSIDEAKRAVGVLHNQDYMSRKLVVSGARSPGRDGERSVQDAS